MEVNWLANEDKWMKLELIDGKGPEYRIWARQCWGECQAE